MDFFVRPAGPQDHTALGELTVEVYRDLLPQRPETRDYMAKIRDMGSRAGDGELLVAVDAASGRVLGGLLFVVPGSPFSNTARPGEGEFRLLAVAATERGRGVGEALVQACLSRAAELGLRAVAISTQPNMSAAHRLYRRLGFVRAPERDWEIPSGTPLWVFVADVT
ncbi:GNAT family N-acetyltransferase [Microbispora sp. RL4-1S]|uniref:GNAT family N-acetyltransferase n=1 Tax=Microbispora oryzae TaxID=2806554 RepID=A0A941AHL6_9ACTN|nr:GNAT family N-acetyltransferase [Microbispora oryzae]MBP2704230.1 GNAT family N-acetyltransferase [Microbispora oryzae]